MITDVEKALIKECLVFAGEEGASDARITLTKSTEDQIATLDGQVDKVTRCADRTVNIALFVDGSFGSFSSNRLERESLRRFIRSAVQTVKMLAPDSFRKLPERERCCVSAVSGKEMNIYDPAYNGIDAPARRRAALDAAVSGKPLEGLPQGVKLVSEEGEYSDSEYDVYVVDSQGLECRHTETSFDYGVEVTIED